MHRDIKPANILVDDDLNVKICDFGLSRKDPKQYDDEEISASSLTLDKKRISRQLLDSAKDRKHRQRCLSNHVTTRTYRAPEIILQYRHYSRNIDLWSLGCVIAEVLLSTTKYSEVEFCNESRCLFPGTSCIFFSPADTHE